MMEKVNDDHTRSLNASADAHSWHSSVRCCHGDLCGWRLTGGVLSFELEVTSNVN